MLLLLYILLSGCLSQPADVWNDDDLFSKIVLCQEEGIEPRELYELQYFYFLDDILIDSTAYYSAISMDEVNYVIEKMDCHPTEDTSVYVIDGWIGQKSKCDVSLYGISRGRFENYISDSIVIDVHINHLGLLGLLVMSHHTEEKPLTAKIYDSRTGALIVSLGDNKHNGKTQIYQLIEKIEVSHPVRVVVLLDGKLNYKDFVLEQHMDKPGTIESTVHSGLPSPNRK